MSLSSLSSAQLHQLIELVKEKEALQGRLREVESALNALESGADPMSTTSKVGRPRKGRRRAKLKDVILKALQDAGKSGLSVKEVAAQLQANPGSVAVWFYTTGKKMKGLRKLGPGRYSFVG